MSHPNLETVLNGTDPDPTIEFCLNNVDQEQRAALSRGDGSIHGFACLQRCGDCAAEPFLVVAGRYVAGDPIETVEMITESDESE